MDCRRYGAITTIIFFTKGLCVYPAPSQILSRAVKMIENGQLISHTLASTRRVMVGFMLSSLVAIPFGIFLGSSRFFMAVFDPLISLLRPLPSMSWIPLSLLWLGITETQKYSIVFMGSFAPDHCRIKGAAGHGHDQHNGHGN